MTAKLELAEIALRHGAPGEALELASAARARAEQLQGGKPHSFRTALASVACAQALLATGDVDASRATARKAVTLLAATVDPNHPAAQIAARLAQAPTPAQP